MTLPVATRLGAYEIATAIGARFVPDASARLVILLPRRGRHRRPSVRLLGFRRPHNGHVQRAKGRRVDE
jgi:hypothetical protein